jgi:sulfite reductase alpha subunit-like flavoprotein
MFLEWSAKLWNVLETMYPMPEEKSPIPENELLPSRYTVSLETSSTLHTTKITPPNSFFCKVIQNKRITTPGHWQDVRHVILESQVPSIHYDPGDIAVVWPENPKEEVEVFLHVLKWTSIADAPLSITHIVTSKPISTLHNPPTLRSLATSYLDICSVPRRSFFEFLKHFFSDNQHVEKFTEFCTLEGQDELWDYTTRPRRTIIEVLSDFSDSLKIPVAYVLDIFPPLKPRRFSIASSLTVFPF